jgi:hypothetical protein
VDVAVLSSVQCTYMESLSPASQKLNSKNCTVRKFVGQESGE